ncbi:MAG: M20 family metallopeptidase [Planctomycetaceae bacterium]|nr:M20 family metallopeptidase [Planctomycetales bacterium]MCB9927273.1 M20 family metallopeptidase [Planctomycetaceae bacterium]
MPLDVVETLRSLVAIPSVNPMGRDDSGDEFYEHRMTDRLEEIFTSLGLPCERQQIAPKRANIVARLDGSEQLLVFEAHQDTVPVDGMTIPPWDPAIHDGRIYGRGSCDIKGGMAAMLAAVSRLADERPAGMPTIVIACSVNEEHGFSGASDMAELWNSGTSRVVPRKPDAIIVAEPTLLNVVVAHKGVVRWRVHTSGRACHSSTPHLGDNAIYHMARVLQQIEVYARDVAPNLGSHPLLGGPTISVGIISGGISVNTVADACVIEIDRRVLPGEDPMAARQHLIDYLADKLDESVPVTHEDPFIASGGLADKINGELATEVSKAASACGSPGELIGVPYGTDAPAFDAIGCPTIVFGPGSIEQAHTKDEWLAIEQLERAVEIYYRIGKQGVA